MNKKMLMILVAGVDIWAALLITQIRRPQANWEVSLATSDSAQAIMPSATTPVQIWIRSGQTGIWPNTSDPLPLPAICDHLEKTATATRTRLEIRLLCDPQTSLSEWGPVAVRMAKYADEVKLAPLPSTK